LPLDFLAVQNCFPLSLEHPQTMNNLALESASVHMDQPLPDYHENHLIKVDLSLIVFLELVLRLLASDNKDQPPSPDHLENHLI
jgi:hypothetical protein